MIPKLPEQKSKKNHVPLFKDRKHIDVHWKRKVVRWIKRKFGIKLPADRLAG